MPAVPVRRVFTSSLLAAAAALPTAAVAAPPVEATPIASFWVGSEAAVRAAATQVGYPLPAAVSLESLAAKIPVFKPGDVRPDAPAGMFILAGEHLTSPRMGAIVVPVRAGTVPLAGLPNAQRTPAADTVTMGGFPFRRTADDVVFGGTADATAALDVAGGAAAMTPAADGSRTPVVAISLDLAKWRSVAPAQFAAAMDAMGKNTPAETDPSRRAGQVWVQRAIRDQLDHVAVAVDQTPAGWTASATLDPFPQAHGSFARPGLPAGCCARADLQLRADATGDWLKRFVKGGGQVTAEDDVGIRLVTALLLGDAETFGVAAVDGRPVLYVVTQRSAPADLAADVAALGRDGRKMPGGRPELQATTYADGHGRTVYRFTDRGQKGKVDGYFDVTARGNTRYATYCPADAHLAEALADLPAEAGRLDTLGAGWVEPGHLGDLIAALDPAGRVVPADRRQMLADLFENARLTWTAKAAGTGATFTTDVPTTMLKGISTAVEMFRQ